MANPKYALAVAEMHGETVPESFKADRQKDREVNRLLERTTNRILGHGPGTELRKMTTQMGIPACQSCIAYAKKMDVWGVKGCREHFEEIVEHLEKESARLGWFKWALAGAKAVKHGLPKTARSLAEEAIRRAEDKAAGRA